MGVKSLHNSIVNDFYTIVVVLYIFGGHAFISGPVSTLLALFVHLYEKKENDVYHHQLTLEMDSLLKQVEKHLNNMRLEPRESMERYISKPFPISSFLKINNEENRRFLTKNEITNLILYLNYLILKDHKKIDGILSIIFQ